MGRNTHWRGQPSQAACFLHSSKREVPRVRRSGRRLCWWVLEVLFYLLPFVRSFRKQGRQLSVRMVEECTHLGEWENKRTGGDGTTAREHESPLRSLSFDRFCRDRSCWLGPQGSTRDWKPIKAFLQAEEWKRLQEASRTLDVINIWVKKKTIFPLNFFAIYVRV